MSQRKGQISSGNHSVLGDKESRNSEISSSSLAANLKRLFDFTQSKIPGLYKTTGKHFILEYCESSAIAYGKFHISSQQFSSKFTEFALVDNGIQYCGTIKIRFGHHDNVKILVPGFRSYDPAGPIGKQYVTSRQFMLLAKLLAAEIKAAQMGVREKRIEKIQKTIESVCSITAGMTSLWNWTHLQVKLACFNKISPPKYYEFILNKVLTEELSLEGRDDCKEYLEKCIKGGDIKVPNTFYRAVLANEQKLPFDLKILYSEIESRETKEEKANAVVLIHLPKMIPNFTSIKEGKSYMKMSSDCERLGKLYDTNVHQNKCKVM